MTYVGFFIEELEQHGNIVCKGGDGCPDSGAVAA
jgi:hypothetical protein